MVEPPAIRGAEKLDTNKKLETKVRNFQIGDIVMLVYPKCKVNDYRVVRVIEFHKNTRNTVHSVTIVFRTRDRCEPLLPYKS